jgi:uncharacterized membrane protein
MENQEESLLGIGIDDVTQSHLISIAKWNRFLAIVGIVMCGLCILLLLFGGSFLLSLLSSMGNREMSQTYGSGMLTGVFIFYAIMGVVFLIPCVYRLNFSVKMLKALASNDQQLLNDSFSNLKTYSQYWGILTIILIGLYGLILVLVLLTVAFIPNHSIG